MSPAHISPAERRANRARRKKLRRNGKRVITVAYLVVGVAVLIGVIGLRTWLDDRDGDDVDTGNSIDVPIPTTQTTRGRRPSAVSTGDTVVVDLVPTTAPAGGSGGGSGSSEAEDAEGTTFGVRSPGFGVVQVAAAPPDARPRPNARPFVTAPAEVSTDAEGNVVITGITITDPDYPGVGDIGVALIGQGAITVTLNQDVKLLTNNAGAFVGIAGPPAALNRSLAELRFQRASEDPVDLLITVTDWAYGDISRSESSYATTRVN